MSKNKLSISLLLMFVLLSAFTFTDPRKEKMELEKKMYNAIAEGDVKEFKELVTEHSADIYSMDGFLYNAAGYGQVEIFKYLVEEQGLSITQNKTLLCQTLYFAAKNGKTNIIDYMVSKGVDVNTRNNNNQTVLHIALGNSQIEEAKYLVSKYGMKIESTDKYGKSALLEADCKSIELIKFLLDQPQIDLYSKDVNGDTILHKCVRQKEPKAVKYLVEEKKMKLDLNNNLGQTPLFLSVFDKNMDMFEYLISKGADVNAKTNKNETLLFYAVGGNKLDIVEYLVEKQGMDVNARDKEMNTPIFSSVKLPNVKIMKYLIKKGADVKVQNIKGETPLHRACYYRFGRSHDDIDLLVKNGVDINAKTKEGKTALDYSKQGEHHTTSTMNYLIELGAK